MSPNDENTRDIRADDAAGTDEEYFALLERRRRALADKRSEGRQSSADAKEQIKRDPAKKTLPDPTRPNHARPDQPRPNQPRPNQPRPNQPRPNQPRPNQPRPDQPRPNQPRPNQPRPDRRQIPLTPEEKRRRSLAAAEAQRRAEAQKAALAARKRAEAARRAEEKLQKKERRRAIARRRREFCSDWFWRIWDVFKLFAVIFILLSAMLISAFAIRLAMTAGKTETDDRDFTYIVEDSRRKMERRIVVRNDVVYVDFTDIAALCGVGISGTRTELVFEAGAGETAVFVPASDRAVLNGNSVVLEGAAEVNEEDEHLWLPLSFVKQYFIGVDAELSEVEKKNKKYLVISISRTPDPESTGALGSYITPSFRLKSGAALSGISPYDTPGIQAPPADPAPRYEFSADLSAYERYMSPDSMTRDSYLLLVNSENRLSYRYTPAALTDVEASRDEKNKTRLSLYAARSLDALLIEAAASGYPTVRAGTGYVSYEEASALFDSYISAERNYSRQNYAATGKRFSDRAYAVLGETYLSENYIQKDNYTLSLADARRVVLSYCDEPGTDEHQSGLCVDLCDISPSGSSYTADEFYAWLDENAHKFGFILRYPADKTEITAHAAEPWHLRYVGRYHAAKMHSSGKCLEEYTA